MRKNTFQKALICSRARHAFLLAALLTFSPGVLQADVLTVDCTGSTPSAFTTIGAALGSLPVNSPTEPHTITVTGTCTENVNISNRQRVTIEAPAGQTATVMNAANPPALVININRSRSITLRRLVITGGRNGVLVDDSSEADMRECTVENNLQTGIQVSDQSNLRLVAVTIQNNGGNGLFVDDGSFAVLGEGPASGPPPFVFIANNGGTGVGVNNSAVFIRGFTTVENNLGTAMNVTGGRIVVTSNTPTTENIFRGNGFGLNIGGASSAVFNGQVLIQNNGAAGLQVFQTSSVNVNVTQLPDGSVRFTTIEGHTAVGVNVVQLGQVNFSGPHLIRNNGNATQPIRGGVRIGGTSRVGFGGGTQVTGNTGPGVQVELNAQLGLSGAVISNNSEEGVLIRQLSVANFNVPGTVSGNASSNVTCDLTSLIVGNLAGISNINCKNIERELGPPRPGQFDPPGQNNNP